MALFLVAGNYANNSTLTTDAGELLSTVQIIQGMGTLNTINGSLIDLGNVKSGIQRGIRVLHKELTRNED